MEVINNTKTLSKCLSIKAITNIFLVLVFLFLFHIQASPFYASTASASYNFFNQWKGTAGGATHHHHHSHPSDELELDALTSKLRDSVTFLPLKDIRFKETATSGNTWFMSSLNDTYEENEAEYLHFPSLASKGRILCIKGHDKRDGTNNSYALAWPGSLPESAILMSGLTFVSDTYYDYGNLWHGFCAMAPFVGWSLRNQCVKPTRWVLFHWGELRDGMGLWLQNVVQANFGRVNVENFENGDGPYCFEKAVVMRHNSGRMGKAKKLEVSDLFRCKAREFCGINSQGKGKEVNESGDPIIRLTLLMRRGPRSFKNSTAVIDIFARECAKVEGCQLKVAQSEDLTFCDQVRVMTYTDIVASPHGAQLTNMLFMDRNGSVMEFFPKGWLELAGVGQYAHHWMADLSGMNHRGAWWEPMGEEKCPFSQEDHHQCFSFFKGGLVGHNETFFAEWARQVLNQVRISKLEQASKSLAIKPHPNACVC